MPLRLYGEKMAQDLVFNKNDLHISRIIDACETGGIKDGQVKIRVDKFGLSANNITYGAFGDHFQYWTFFPAPDGWGRIPVWGFGDVVESNCAEIDIGERLYGYFPMSNYMIAQPSAIKPSAWGDATSHRSQLPRVYNRYVRVKNDALYDPSMEGERMVLNPLFGTSFILSDFLTENEQFGANSIVMTSASSKTALGTAFMLNQDKSDHLKLVALTSPSNKKFVEELKLYHQVLSYDQVADLPRNPSVLLEFSGNRSIVKSVHETIGEHLTYSCTIGATHWDTIEDQANGLEGVARNLPGPEPKMFHAPNQIHKRHMEIGAEEYTKRFSGSWTAFAADSKRWMTIVEVEGLSGAQQVCSDLLLGNTDPRKGFVVRLS